MTGAAVKLLCLDAGIAQGEIPSIGTINLSSNASTLSDAGAGKI